MYTHLSWSFLYKVDLTASMVAPSWPCFRMLGSYLKEAMNREPESPYKRHLQHGIKSSATQDVYRNSLSTIGMRIRQAVDNGYQVPRDSKAANNCVQDNSDYTIPEYKRVPMRNGTAAPMLVNQRTVSSSSTLEEWDSQLDERLNLIDDNIMRNKLGARDLMLGGTKRGFEELAEDGW
ncbi:HGL276Cp [Eremothecium sinecaudum]|uniref:Damage-regulated import facilitator 1 n=1 Tax=Eremothecium sinecaudum TaxID=45286 RepID=A0A0X8HV35_9SACH|nr:HGL276Cp [Eremothecium sinecaudum]AMD22064.1 HGL276Cp [Eremothecium sinecaudum]